MQKFIKRLLSLVLVAALLASLGLTAFAQGSSPKEISQAAYDAADAIFDGIDRVQSLAAKRSSSQDAQTQAICDYLYSADGVEAGSVQANGDYISWRTEQGIACSYSPRLERIAAAAQSIEDNSPDAQSVSFAKRASQHGADVYLFQPYYGLDSSFTKQYQTEAERIASATEGTYHYYKGEKATIDSIADAIEDGGVIIFDSHGSTDYENGSDYTSGATISYLCLQSGEGLTEKDYQDDHAVYSGSSGSMRYYLVDGTAITNHMESGANNGLVWMAICLGMATDGLCAPFMEKGVGAVYGYSQSVTFVGDYTFEAAFFDSLLGGGSISEAAEYMKNTCGQWDYSPQIIEANNMPSSYTLSTIDAARRGKAAFPIIVSDEDAYPGKGTVDGLQTVNASWSLLKRYELSVNTDSPDFGSVTRKGMTITAVPNEGYYTSGCSILPEGAATVRQDGNTLRVSALRSDCTVTVHFEAKTAAAVSFSVPEGVTQADMPGYVGDSIVLPTPSGTPAEKGQDYHFVGWSEEKIDSPVLSASIMHAGDRYTLTGTSATLYAVYQYLATSEGKTPVFSEVTSSEDWSGLYVITASGKALRGDGTLEGVEMGSKDAAGDLAAAGISIENGNLSGASGEYAVQVVRVPNSDQYAIRLAGAMTPVYLACRTNSDQLSTAADFGSSFARWNISFTDGSVVIRNARFAARTLQFAENEGYFRCFAKAQTAPTLYRGEDSNVWYLTELSRTPASYTLTFAVNGGSAVEPVTATEGTVIDLSAYKTQLSGYDFTGWYADEKLTQPVSSVTLTADTMVWAGWTKHIVPAPEMPFVDVPKDAYYHDAVQWAFEGKVTTGKDETHFAPDDNCTRAQFVTLLWRLKGEPEAKSAVTAFTDVNSSAYYYKALCWASEQGIAKGITDTQFDPDGIVSRGQAVTFIWRAEGKPTGGGALFNDVASDSYCAEAVSWAVERGIAKGVGSQSFDPNGSCTRAHTVTFLYRLTVG